MGLVPSLGAAVCGMKYILKNSFRHSKMDVYNHTYTERKKRRRIKANKRVDYKPFHSVGDYSEQ